MVVLILSIKIFFLVKLFFSDFVNSYWLFFENHEIICYVKNTKKKICPEQQCIAEEVPDQL